MAEKQQAFFVTAYSEGDDDHEAQIYIDGKVVLAVNDQAARTRVLRELPAEAPDTTPVVVLPLASYTQRGF